MRISLFSIFPSLTLFAFPISAAAQILPADAERFGKANVEVSHECPKFAERETELAKPSDGVVLVSGSRLATEILGGFVGDVAAAGLNAVGNALEEASRKKAFGVEGRATFDFYSFGDFRFGVIRPTLGFEYGCLVIKAYDNFENLPDGIKRGPDGKIIPLVSDPHVSIEAQILPMRDGFIVRPVYINYARRVTGAPRKRAKPTELHLSFSMPKSLGTDGSNESSFAVTRMKLPAMQPGDIRWAEQIGTQSEVLPFRPLSGTSTELKIRLGVADRITAARDEILKQEVLIANALGFRYPYESLEDCIDAPCPDFLNNLAPRLAAMDTRELATWAKKPSSGVPKARLKRVNEAETEITRQYLELDVAKSILQKRVELEAGRVEGALDDAISSTLDLAERAGLSDEEEVVDLRKTRQRFVARLKAAELDDTPALTTLVETNPYDRPVSGATSVMARFVIVRNENRFGKAIADALKKQAAPVSEFVKGKVAQEGEPTWSQAQSDFVLARLDVEQKQRAFSEAVEEGDQQKIDAAETALLTAKVTANLRASAIDVVLPYPELQN
ncbi:hypothetical protein ACRAQ7_03745 [Erythrobacter sp. W53]|uniref:hypothetical protein n=1 Tax=Erythrobacter sp. W53 TaxID=3425947 RepID=UPI003D768225